MKKQNKIFTILVLLLIFSIVGVGCSNLKSQASQKNCIGVTVYTFDDTWITNLRNEMYKEAGDKTQIDIWGGNNSQAVQNKQIDKFIERRVNSIGVNIVDTNAASSIILKAKQANVPIVFMNRQPSSDDLQKWNKVYYVGSKPEQSGIMQGEILASYFKIHPTQDGIIRYVMIKGENTNKDTELRSKYSIETLENSGFKVEKIAEDTAMWNRSKAQNKMTDILNSYGEKFDCVIANNDEMALGAVDALKLRGYFSSGKYMPVVGIDGEATAIKAVKAGTLLGTVLNDAVGQGSAAFKLCNILSKGIIPNKSNFQYTITENKYVWIPNKIITKQSVNDMK